MCSICKIRTYQAYPVYIVTAASQEVYRAACREIAADEAAKRGGQFALEPRQDGGSAQSCLEYDTVYAAHRAIACGTP